MHSPRYPHTPLSPMSPLALRAHQYPLARFCEMGHRSTASSLSVSSLGSVQEEEEGQGGEAELMKEEGEQGKEFEK